VTAHSIYAVLSKPFRKRRLARFLELFPPCRVVDFGGTASMWSELGFDVTLLNLDTGLRGDIAFVCGDVCNAPFRDNAFALSFSNSVIEHVGEWRRQKQMASEMLRCGQMIYCQTPNFWFPIEPHLLMPFAHWIPGFCKNYFCVRYLTPIGLLTKLTRVQFESEFSSIRLLSERDMKSLFPKARIMKERVFGITKSLIAFQLTE